MEEADIIKAIKILGEIKPSRKWVGDLETRILGKKPMERFFDFPARIREFVPSFDVFTQRFPALVFARVVVIALIVAGAFWGLANISNISKDESTVIVNPYKEKDNGADYYLTMAEKELEKVKTELSFAQEKTIDRQKIQQINATIKTASQKIPKTAKNPQEAALIVGKVVSINQKVKEVSAALSDTELDTEDLTHKTTQMVEDGIKSTVSELLILFEKVSTNDAQKVLLEEAKANFNAGLYQESLEVILKMTGGN